MRAFDAGVIDGMNKTAGIKSWVKAPIETYKALRATGAKPMGRLSAALQTAKKRKGQTAAAGGALLAGGAGTAYLAGGRKKTAAASNPAQAPKSSLSSGAPEAQRFAPYLNQGGGAAGQHQAGPVASVPQPWPGHVNIGDKSPGQQAAGAVAMDTSPDTGERGTSNTGDMVRTKSAAFVAGIGSVLDDE